MFNEFLFGCCYYPEHWDECDLESDMKGIKDIGFNVIRMGEFAWSMYEKNEGEYNFSELIKAVECAQKYGINVILGTPTAAPPKWLIDKHPEVLCADKNLQTMHHGSRQHHNHTSEVYLQYCRKITKKMAECFKDYDNVIGWQIDNEINCHRSLSYSEADNIAFRKWLLKKYGTIENLNNCWGNRFWSLEFNDFLQITCPYPTPTHMNPSWFVDFLLFSSDSAINFAKVQRDVLKEITPNKFVTHNGIFSNIDNYKFTNEVLDFMCFDSYPAFSEHSGKMRGRNWGYRLSKVRGLSGKFLVLEQQSGPGGQLNYLLQTPEPGQIRLWTYQSIAHGGVGVLYFRWRTAVYGAEQLWYGIHDHDGKENYRSAEIREIAKELSMVGELFLKDQTVNDVAIYNDYHNECNNEIESFAADDSRIIFEHLNKQNIKSDFVYDLDNLDYKVLIIPHIVIATDEMATKIEQFAQKGGIVIISARSGTKNLNNHYYRTTPPGVFAKLVGAEVEWFTNIPVHLEQSISFNGKNVTPKTYLEVLKPTTATTIATYTDRFYAGKPAFTKNGNIYYLGTYFDEQTAEVYDEIIKQHIKLPYDNLDKAIEVFNYKNHLLFLNYADFEVTLPNKCFDLISQKEIEVMPAYGVLIIEK